MLRQQQRIAAVPFTPAMPVAAAGDAINVASRLEGVNKEFATTILVSDAGIRATSAEFSFAPIGEARAKGREESVAIYVLTG